MKFDCVALNFLLVGSTVTLFYTVSLSNYIGHTGFCHVLWPFETTNRASKHLLYSLFKEICKLEDNYKNSLQAPGWLGMLSWKTRSPILAVY